MNKYFTVLFLILLSFQSVKSQFLYSSSADSILVATEFIPPNQDTVIKFNPKKPLWVPIVESFALNSALSGFNFLMGSEFAKISTKTVLHNFERGWATDADGFITNMFGHPINGSIYYNLAKSSGYDYWTSLSVAAIGSLHWEFLMENEPPSFNDWIMTAYGGSIIGEVFYKLSNLIIDEKTTGSERVFREIGAGIFNPGRLFNRLISGRTSRVTNANLYRKEQFLGEVSFGGNNVADGLNFENGERNPMLTLDIVYGKLFKTTKIKPFDFFRLNLALNFAKQPIIGQMQISNIFGGFVKDFGNDHRILGGTFGHFYYLENTIYQIGGVSIGVGGAYRSPMKKDIHFITSLHLGAVLMGGANSNYSTDYNVDFLDSARTYNIGPGAMVSSESILRLSFGSIYLKYNFWWIHTWDGAPGDEIIGMLAPKIRFRIYENWFLGIEYLYYHRRGKYDELQNVSYKNNEERIFVGYAF